MGFLRGDADVLVSTSIIESGIDIPQANTLIVERADLFGLSQLYQIRGRVGRSRERAYAYLLYPSAARADAGGGRPAVGARRLHRARRRLQGRDARPRAARRRQPARRRAVRPRRRARLRALHADARRGRARDGPPTRTARSCREPVRLDVNVDAYVPPTTSPTSRPRSTCTAGSRARARSPSWSSCARELDDRFGELAGAAREPDHAPAGAHQARPGGRARRHVPRRPARGHADRARLRARRAGCARRSRARSTSRAARSSRCACPTTRRSASRRWSGPRTRC